MPSAPPLAGFRNDTSNDLSQQPTAQALAAYAYEPRKARVGMLRRVTGAVRRALEAHRYDSAFERPDLIEDDYFRFRNQPRD
jgi:hypothetical protein